MSPADWNTAVQIVYLCARPALLAGTIASVRTHLSFVDRILVVAPERAQKEVSALGAEVITDKEMLGKAPPDDHQRRNWALRSALASHEAVDEVFIMSDDDSRPLVHLDETTFIHEGRFRRYMFGWLDEWHHQSSSFDLGQQATRQVLGLYGFPRRAYASHMPQVIDKVMLAEVVELLSTAAGLSPLCEWTSYFNVAPARHPGRFHDPEPYVTLGWPENSAAWQPTVEPAALVFENFFPEHYADGAVFQGIDPNDCSVEAAIEKVVRWRHYELEVLSGQREPTIGKPPPATAVARSLRRARAVTLGDPLQRERDQRAALAALLRALRRR